MVKGEYKTVDLTEATYLSFLGIDWEVDRRNPNQVVFIFKGDVEFILQRADYFFENSPEQKLLAEEKKMKKAVFGSNYKYNFSKMQEEDKK